MKVVRASVSLKERPWYGKCIRCGSSLEAEHGELMRCIYGDEVKVGDCPVCEQYDIIFMTRLWSDE